MRTTASPRVDGTPRSAWLPGREAWLAPLRRAGVARLGVLVGSFDPPHLGHEWMASRLLERTEAVLFLVPTRHYRKRVQPPHNASFPQRLEMLRLAAQRLPGLAVAGLTGEVLFVRLARRLRRLLPGTAIVFGMGTDTFLKAADSARYAPLLGAGWSPADEAELPPVLASAVVFGRHAQGVPGSLEAPWHLRDVSSTAVRRTVAALRAARAPENAWRRELGGMLAGETSRWILASDVYRSSAAPGDSMVPASSTGAEQSPGLAGVEAE